MNDSFQRSILGRGLTGQTLLRYRCPGTRKTPKTDKQAKHRTFQKPYAQWSFHPLPGHNWGFGFLDHSTMIEQLICGMIEKGVRV
jgi:hypothetical protein